MFFESLIFLKKSGSQKTAIFAMILGSRDTRQTHVRDTKESLQKNISTTFSVVLDLVCLMCSYFGTGCCTWTVSRITRQVSFLEASVSQ